MRTAIQNVLVDVAKNGTFYPVLYDDVEGATLKRDELDELVTVAPASAEANEVSADFGIDTRHTTSYAADRTRWEWELVLRFNQEVSVTQFEEALNQSVICIPRSEDMPRQARAILSSATYTHPPRKGASNGSEARYRFIVSLSAL
jgi:hypothetical protein